MSLQLNGISVRRAGRTILHNVDLAVAPGEVVAVLGPNGAGKSTLLAVAAGDLAPDSGQVTLDGQALQRFNGAALARRRAVLPQRDGLNFPFTVGEVVGLGRIPHAGQPGGAGADRQAIASALAEAGLSQFGNRTFTALSGGERQRVQLARVLAQLEGQADVARWMLLDEPSSALDLAHQQRLVAVVRRAAQRGIGVFVILHDPTLAAAMADRIVLLAQGQVLADGPAERVLTGDHLLSLYGLPVLTLQDARLAHVVVQPVWRQTAS